LAAIQRPASTSSAITSISANSLFDNKLPELDLNDITGILNIDEEMADNYRHVSKDLSHKKKDKRINKLVDWKFLTLDYQPCDWTQEMAIKPLSSLSVGEQESALIEDLLFILIVSLFVLIFYFH
jgi:hypothetical protein